MADYKLKDKIKNLQIIDDQNLDMMDDNQDEDQHYPDEDEEQENQEMDMDMEMNYDQLGDIDPELLQAAQKLGLDEEGIRMLQ
jgi:hypothetical protein